MILSDKDLKVALESRKLIIDPIGDPDKQIQPASVDLRLDTQFTVFHCGEFPYIHPAETDMATITRKVVVPIGEKFILHPGQFVLASTMEWVSLPSDLVGRVDGRSSVGRLGVLMHVTAGFIDPGFSGKITLELYNVNRMPVALVTGERVCQISFDWLTTPAERPYGTERNSKYQNQGAAQVSLIQRDFTQ